MKEYLEDLRINFRILMNSLMKKHKMSVMIHTNNQDKSYLRKRLQTFF